MAAGRDGAGAAAKSLGLTHNNGAEMLTGNGMSF